MKYIFHISDIHIDVDRYENIFNSFNILINDIIKQGVKNSMLVIVGDIFENKTILTTSELNIFDELVHPSADDSDAPSWLSNCRERWK